MVADSKGTTILVVDDEPKMRHILRLILEEAGYSVLEAQNGLEALDIISRNPCGVVFTDLKMDGMTGVELLKNIKENHPEIPVVMVTAFGSVESAVEAMHAGALDYITKPFEEEKIIVTAERCLKFYQLAERKSNPSSRHQQIIRFLQYRNQLSTYAQPAQRSRPGVQKSRKQRS